MSLARISKIRQYKYCPDCNRKLKTDCGICRKLICLNCDLGITHDTDYNYIHKACKTEDNNQLQEVNVDTIRGLSYSNRIKILITRAEWLKRQRKQDRLDIRRRETQKYKHLWTKQGLCPNCKEHEPIFKGGDCLKCYGTRIRSARARAKAEKESRHKAKEQKQKRKNKEKVKKK